MIIFFLGPPGSGKSTQSILLAERLGIKSISMGKILRDAQEGNSVLAKETKKYMDEGILIPSKIIQSLIKFRLEEKDCQKGFILDGTPRNVAEAVFLDSYLQSKGLELHKVYLFEITDNEVIKRLLIRSKLPKDKDGGRSDDNIKDIKNRLFEYDENIYSIKEYYNKQDKLVTINGNQGVEEIHKQVISDLQL